MGSRGMEYIPKETKERHCFIMDKFKFREKKSGWLMMAKYADVGLEIERIAKLDFHEKPLPPIKVNERRRWP
jgi:hypothetical protein